MKYLVSFRLGGWAVALLLLSSTLCAQTAKENRNNYAKPLPKTDKIKFSVQQQAEPFIFSPHLSYKEQKQIQVAKKKIGGITFVVKPTRANSNGNSSANYKRQTPNTRARSASSEQYIADTTAPFVRYELTDSSKSVNR
jgi:hypothetical protein